MKSTGFRKDTIKEATKKCLGRVLWIGIDTKRWKDVHDFDIGENDGRPTPKKKGSQTKHLI